MNKVLIGDVIEKLKEIPTGTFQVVITSPPYNKGLWRQRDFTKRKQDAWTGGNIDYGEVSDNRPHEEYVAWQKEVIEECLRVLKPDGSLFYNHKALVYKHGLVYPTWVFDYTLRQQIIWDRGSSPSIYPNRWLPTTEYIFWITKERKQPKFLGWKGKQKTEVWRIPPKPMKEHPAPFPEELVEEILLATTELGDAVLDPFAGSGTSLAVAKHLGRDYLGIELNEKYLPLIEERLSKVIPLSERVRKVNEQV